MKILLLSKVGIMLGSAETYRFDLGTLTMCHEEYEAAVAAFIRRNGVTRCPTACALPTQAAPAAADQAALSVTRHGAVSLAGSRPRDAAGRTGSPKSWQHDD